MAFVIRIKNKKTNRFLESLSGRPALNDQLIYAQLHSAVYAKDGIHEAVVEFDCFSKDSPKKSIFTPL